MVVSDGSSGTLINTMKNKIWNVIQRYFKNHPIDGKIVQLISFLILYRRRNRAVTQGEKNYPTEVDVTNTKVRYVRSFWMSSVRGYLFLTIASLTSFLCWVYQLIPMCQLNRVN